MDCRVRQQPSLDVHLRTSEPLLSQVCHSSPSTSLVVEPPSPTSGRTPPVGVLHSNTTVIGNLGGILATHLSAILQCTHISRWSVSPHFPFTQLTYLPATVKTIQYEIAVQSLISHMYINSLIGLSYWDVSEFHFLLSSPLVQTLSFFSPISTFSCRFVISSVLPCHCADLRLHPLFLFISYLFVPLPPRAFVPDFATWSAASASATSTSNGNFVTVQIV